MYNISKVNVDLFNTGTARQFMVSHEIQDLQKWWSTFNHEVETVDSLLCYVKAPDEETS